MILWTNQVSNLVWFQVSYDEILMDVIVIREAAAAAVNLIQSSLSYSESKLKTWNHRLKQAYHLVQGNSIKGSSKGIRMLSDKILVQTDHAIDMPSG